MLLTLIFCCVLLGVFVGISAGLLGIGGGLIIVPALVYLLPLVDVPPANVMSMAIATSLASIIITSLSAAYAHYLKGNINFKIASKLMQAIVVGSLIGAVTAHYLSFEFLTLFFAAMVVVMSLQMMFSMNFASQKPMPSSLGLYFIGMFVGILASLMGVGGGVILVPILTYFSLPIRHAMGIASACGICVALFGSLGFILTGYQQVNLPDWSLGYVYLPAFLAIISTSFIFAPLGVKLAHSLPVIKLKKIFAVLLILVAGKMISNIVL